MDLSIVIPIYNIDYNIIKRSIDSIKFNDDISFEILLIDDGSNKKYSELYRKIKNVKYYFQENKGVSSARNLGIMKSSGKFITFLDADDILYCNILKKDIFLSSYDLIFFNKKLIIKNKEYRNRECDIDCGEVNCQLIIKEFVLNGKFSNPVSKLYRREFLINNNIYFDVNLIQGEDAIFNINILSQEPRLFYIDDYLYGYYYNIETYNNRWNKYPQKMLDNFLLLYSIKEKMINCSEIHFNTKERDKLNLKYLNSVFSIYMTLIDKKQLSSDIYKELMNFMNHLNIEENLSFSLIIKKLIIEKNIKILSKSISKIRNIYLYKIKRKYSF